MVSEIIETGSDSTFGAISIFVDFLTSCSCLTGKSRTGKGSVTFTGSGVLADVTGLETGFSGSERGKFVIFVGSGDFASDFLTCGFGEGAFSEIFLIISYY